MLRESYLIWLLQNCEKLGRWLRVAIEDEIEARKNRFLFDGDIELGLCNCQRSTFWNNRFPLSVYDDKFEVAEVLSVTREPFKFVVSARRVGVRGICFLDNYLNLWPGCGDLTVVAKVHELFYVDDGKPFP